MKIASGEFTAAAKAAAEELNTACCFGIAAALKQGTPATAPPSASTPRKP